MLKFQCFSVLHSRALRSLAVLGRVFPFAFGTDVFVYAFHSPFAIFLVEVDTDLLCLFFFR